MKYYKLVFIPLLLLAAVAISLACEPDDICPAGTPTTPRLVIDLYDAQNGDNKKNVFKLVAIGSDFYTNPMPADTDKILEDYNFLSQTDEIRLPLKTTENATKFVLIKDAFINDNGTPNDPSDDFIDGNADTISMGFSREEVYVSRACGYKTIYKNVTLTIEPDEDNWMLSSIPLSDNQSVEDDFQTHFNITH
ncbi:hypothetical protein KFZ70_15435 [Tamlana fucoidanivorans]|uniref:DUF1735 domain-containing protein n=1 Tax=Allotamlana fucoidanivorans TaxID=2583814 RepID=A0A5C4SFL7_9FLAO|nr:DUF6452 family protein [Tamlana fucoidanivorans]TNJ42154.1 hypothetical protein FGF67_14745 [Tamlana fucoidanivorans]